MKNMIFLDFAIAGNSAWEDMLEKAGMDRRTTLILTFVPAPNSAEFIKEYLAKHGDVGGFAIVARDRGPFAASYPNNVVEFQDDVAKAARCISYIFRGFGREPGPQKKVFVVSDTHFFHANIIKYCNRPWTTAEEMNDALVERWNAKVGPDDIVFHLGDFSFGNREKVESVFRRLNGKINLVMGNHDRLKVRDYYEIGFNRVYDRPIVYDNFFILSHEPIQWVKEGLVYANIFGHVHDSEMYRTWTKNSCCVCVERHDYAPIPFGSIKDRLIEMNADGGK